eukprot:5326552-Amphidinium_carterae.2
MCTCPPSEPNQLQLEDSCLLAAILPVWLFPARCSICSTCSVSFDIQEGVHCQSTRLVSGGGKRGRAGSSRGVDAGEQRASAADEGSLHHFDDI